MACIVCRIAGLIVPVSRLMILETFKDERLSITFQHEARTFAGSPMFAVRSYHVRNGLDSSRLFSMALRIQYYVDTLPMAF